LLLKGGNSFEDFGGQARDHSDGKGGKSAASFGFGLTIRLTHMYNIIYRQAEPELGQIDDQETPMNRQLRKEILFSNSYNPKHYPDFVTSIQKLSPDHPCTRRLHLFLDLQWVLHLDFSVGPGPGRQRFMRIMGKYGRWGWTCRILCLTTCIA
jgi:hypothetical protein